MEIGRNFANKIWNAGRFLLMKNEIAKINEVCPCNENKILTFNEMSIADKWILSRFHSTINNIDIYLNNYKVNDYSKLLYDFIWRDFCDWYVEIIKIQLNNREGSYQQALIRFSLSLYEGIIKLLHPVMPFITEEIYHLLYNIAHDKSISLEKFPVYDPSFVNIEVEEGFAFLQEIIEEIRSMRASSNIPPQKKLPVIIRTSNSSLIEFLNHEIEIIKSLANASDINISSDTEKPQKALTSVVKEVEIYINFGDDLDIGKEKERIRKEILRLENNIKNSRAKLSNEGFLNKANPDIIQFEKEKLNSMENTLKKTIENLNHMENIS
jgi:valyl-tRNA synthetase